MVTFPGVGTLYSLVRMRRGEERSDARIALMGYCGNTPSDRTDFWVSPDDPGCSMNLEELADAELGPGAREGRAEFLDDCRKVGRLLQVEETTVQSIIGSLYWLVVQGALERRRGWWAEYLELDDPRQGNRSFAGRSVRAESMVVAHGDPLRFSLVLLDPEFEGRQPLVQEIAPEQAASAVSREFDLRHRTSDPRSLQGIVLNLMRRSRGSRIDPFAVTEQLGTAVRHYAMMQPGGVVVVRRPRLVQTSGLVPAAPVRTFAGETSTAGMVFEVSSHELLITAANHAVTDDSVEVAGVPAEVVGRHGGTDSCVLRVRYTPDCALFVRARQLHHQLVQTLPPRPHEDARFVGAASGLVHTKVRAHDPSIMFRMPEFASKLYTDCDTVDGDSGATLYDSKGKAIGFAAYRTAYGEDPSYSVWIWAKQVLELHKLDRL
jgi:hypothetical protein